LISNMSIIYQIKLSKSSINSRDLSDSRPHFQFLQVDTGLPKVAPVSFGLPAVCEIPLPT
jgi:hypothetical protein